MLKFSLYGNKINIVKKYCSNFLREINNRYPQSKILQYIKRNNCVLPYIVQRTLICGVPTVYIDTNESGKASYKSSNKNGSKYFCFIEKSELYSVLMVLLDISVLLI